MTGIHSNNAYQTTLLDRINCMDTTSAYFKRLRYQKADLVRHFKLHNICEGSEPIIYASATKISEPDTKPAAEPSKLISARSEPIAFQTNERQRKRVHYIGIEGNRLVRQLFNMSGNNDVFNNPYVLQYSMNKRTTGRGFNVGFSYDNNTLSGNSTAGTPVDTKLRTVFFRMGFDRKWAWGKRWTGVFGFDFLLSGSLDRTTTNNTTFGTVTTETHSNGGGLGPRFGLMYHISEKIFLGTEASFYFQSFNEFENASFIGPNPGPGPGPFISNPNQTRTTFSLTPPVGLYLIIKFRE